MGDPKPCEACNSIQSSPTRLEEMRFEYAWKWFDFHAEQRTKMFNYMLIGMGIFATAFVTAVDKKLELEAAILSSAAVVIALVFCFIDHRNRQLYIVAMDVLIHLEKNVVFADRPGNLFLNHRGEEKRYGISSRVAWEDMSPDERQRLAAEPPQPDPPRSYVGSLKHQIAGMKQGQHRYWMPFVALSFATLFLGAATRSWLTYLNAVPQLPVATEGVALFLIGAVYARSRWVTSKKSDVWPVASMFLGSCLALIAALNHSVRDRLVPSTGFDVSVGADLNNLLDLRIRQPLTNALDGQLGTIVSAQLGPFETGSAVLDCKSAIHSRAINDIQEGLTAAVNRKQRVAVVLVGSTDRTPLSPSLRQQYGSDAGLARARVSAVESCLWPKGAENTKPTDVLRVITGPSYTPQKQEAASAAQGSMEADRSVRVMLVGLQSK
jgi:hypothetical protein